MIGIIITVCDRYEMLACTLATIHKGLLSMYGDSQKYSDIQIIIIDDRSTDERTIDMLNDFVDIVESSFFGVHIYLKKLTEKIFKVKNNDKFGYGEIVTIGLKYLEKFKPECVILIQDDIFLNESWLNLSLQFIEFIQNNPSNNIGSFSLFRKDTFELKKAGYSLQNKNIYEYNELDGNFIGFMPVLLNVIDYRLDNVSPFGKLIDKIRKAKLKIIGFKNSYAIHIGKHTKMGELLGKPVAMSTGTVNPKPFSISLVSKDSGYPAYLEIELTNKCQLKCKFCPRPLMKRPEGIMEWKLFKKIIDESRGKSKLCNLHLMGEPLLVPYLTDAINYASEAGIYTRISTNGLALDEIMIKKLLNSKLDEIILCLDSLNKTTYEILRKGSNFKSVKENIFKFIDLRKSSESNKLIVGVQLIKIQNNIKEIEEWIKMFENKLSDLPHKVIIKEYSTFAGHVSDIGIDTQSFRNRCRKPFNSITIYWNGDVVLCCRDFDKFVKMGSLKNYSIQEIFNSEKYRCIRDKFNKKDWIEFCKNC